MIFISLICQTAQPVSTQFSMLISFRPPLINHKKSSDPSIAILTQLIYLITCIKCNKKYLDKLEKILKYVNKKTAFTRKQKNERYRYCSRNTFPTFQPHQQDIFLIGKDMFLKLDSKQNTLRTILDK